MSNWLDPQPVTIPADLQAALGEHPLVAQALVRRGVTTVSAARAFLDPDAYLPAPPLELPGIETAVHRLLQAIQAQEAICVWGDFDVDGQTATTLLVEILRDLGAQVTYHIPVRERESHGVHLPSLTTIIQSGISVVLTCDTGIAAVEAAAFARDHGVDFLITDHHELPARLPVAYSITNPRLLPAGHPLGSLPGVGVAYKLAESLLEQAGRSEQLEGLLDLVALGIVADVALLSGDTRYLLQRGLETLKEPQRLGLKTLISTAGLNPQNITAEHIGFIIAPRMNALGRLGDANSIVELLTTKDPIRAQILAMELEGVNARRQLLTSQVFQAAQAQLDNEPALLDSPVLVLSHHSWPAGVLGIVASRLVEHYKRPAILISAPPGQVGRGSARSIEGVHITQALSAISARQPLLEGFGGHAMAAGFSIQSENIPAFQKALSSEVTRQLGDRRPESELVIDGYLSFPELSLELVADLERLAPFGPGNPPLVLASRDLRLISQRTIGRNAEHLLLTVQDQADNRQEIVWWQGAGWPLPEGRFDLAYTIQASDYRGQSTVQVQWLEYRLNQAPASEIPATPKKPIVEDYRKAEKPLSLLSQLREKYQGQQNGEEKGLLITWREGRAKEALSGQDRLECFPARTLIVWTIPPGRAELQAVLETVHPETIILFADDPGMDQPNAFLERLAGLAKYTLNKQGGETTLSRLAAATAQRNNAVLAGLDWLQAKGVIGYSRMGSDGIVFSTAAHVDPQQQSLAETRLRAALQESAAFRAFYLRSEPEGLL